VCFVDESGFLMAPTRRTCLAPAGRTPALAHGADPRRKVSAAAALCLSPVAGHARLRFRTYPDQYVDNYLYAEFLRDLLAGVRGPVVLIPDNAPSHTGDWTDELLEDYPWLADFTFPLPPYAPDRNPVDHLWAHAKGHGGLAHYAAADVRDLDDRLHRHLRQTARDQPLLRSFFRAAELPW
jgi:transposase